MPRFYVKTDEERRIEMEQAANIKLGLQRKRIHQKQVETLKANPAHFGWVAQREAERIGKVEALFKAEEKVVSDEISARLRAARRENPQYTNGPRSDDDMQADVEDAEAENKAKIDKIVADHVARQSLKVPHYSWYQHFTRNVASLERFRLTMCAREMRKEIDRIEHEALRAQREEKERIKHELAIRRMKEHNLQPRVRGHRQSAENTHEAWKRMKAVTRPDESDADAYDAWMKEQQAIWDRGRQERIAKAMANIRQRNADRLGFSG